MYRTFDRKAIVQALPRRAAESLSIASKVHNPREILANAPPPCSTRNSTTQAAPSHLRASEFLQATQSRPGARPRPNSLGRSLTHSHRQSVGRSHRQNPAKECAPRRSQDMTSTTATGYDAKAEAAMGLEPESERRAPEVRARPAILKRAICPWKRGGGR